MAEPIISVSGLRGVIGETLTPDAAIRYVAAFAAWRRRGDRRRPRQPSVGQDARRGHFGGHRGPRPPTLDAGIVPTPTAGVLVRQLRRGRRVQITASHNPSPYNGIKLFSAAGRVIPADVGEQVLARYRRGDFPGLAHDRLGASRSLPDPLAGHLDAVLATVDVPRIRAGGSRWCWTRNHGAGGALGRRLLEALGCQTTILGETPDGQFAHPPEPTAENLAGVLAAVPAAGADVGFCQDPDADRLAVIDRAGRYIGEEYTVALCVQHVLRQRPGPIVVNCASSRMSQDVAERYGVPLVRSAVGEANVVDAMLRSEAVFGGEGNGGPIDPRVGLVRDSFVGHGPVVGRHGRARDDDRELVAELPRYEIVKTKIPLAAERLPAALDALEAHFRDAAARSSRRPAAGLARPVAVGSRQQHGADCPRDRRGPTAAEAARCAGR